MQTTVAGSLPRGAEVGGGLVARPFTHFNRRTNKMETLKPGRELSATEINEFNPVNLRAIVEKGMLHVWPRGQEPAVVEAKPEPMVSDADAIAEALRSADDGAENHVVQRGFGRHIHYDVIRGVKVNEAPLTKIEAEILAGVSRETSDE